MFEVFDTLVDQRPDPTGCDAPVELVEPLRVLVGSAGYAMTTAAVVDCGGLDDQTLRQVVLGAEQLRRTLDATEAHALAELADRDVTDRTDGTSTNRWLARDAQIPSGVARQRVRVASALRHRLPEQVGRALTDGQIGFDHARVIAEATNDRNVDQLSDEIDRHLDSARGATVFHSWRRSFQARAAVLDADGTFDPNRELARNRLRLSPSAEFMELRGELVGDHAFVVRDSLEAIADELFHAYTRDHTANPDIAVPDRATLLALALEAACRRAFRPRTAGSPTPPPQRASGPRTQVHLVLHGRPNPDGGISLDPIGFDRDGCPWPLRDLGVLLCDASVAATILDGLGSRPTPADPHAPPVHVCSAERSTPATADVSTPAATDRHATATPTTSSRGSAAAERSSRTSCCCAADTTVSRTGAAGGSCWTPTAGPGGPPRPDEPSGVNATRLADSSNLRGPTRDAGRRSTRSDQSAKRTTPEPATTSPIRRAR